MSDENELDELDELFDELDQEEESNLEDTPPKIDDANDLDANVDSPIGDASSIEKDNNIEDATTPTDYQRENINTVDDLPMDKASTLKTENNLEDSTTPPEDVHENIDINADLLKEDKTSMVNNLDSQESINEENPQDSIQKDTVQQQPPSSEMQSKEKTSTTNRAQKPNQSNNINNKSIDTKTSSIQSNPDLLKKVIASIDPFETSLSQNEETKNFKKQFLDIYSKINQLTSKQEFNSNDKKELKKLLEEGHILKNKIRPD